MSSFLQSTNRNYSESTQQNSKFPSKTIKTNCSTASELSTKSNIEKFYQIKRNQINFQKNQINSKNKKTVSKNPYQGFKNEYFFNLAMINLNKYQDDILVRNSNDNNSIYDLKNFISEINQSKNQANNFVNYCLVNPDINKNTQAENNPTQLYNRVPSNFYLNNNNNTSNIKYQNGNLYTETKNTINQTDEKLIYILNKLELFDLIEVFRNNCISFEDLFLLTKEDLYEMNIPIGPRNRLINFIEQYKKYARTFHIQEINSFLQQYTNINNINNNINKNYTNSNYNTILNLCGSNISLNEKSPPKDNNYKQITTTSPNFIMRKDSLDSNSELPGKGLVINDLSRGDNNIDINETPKITKKNGKIRKNNINNVNKSQLKSSYKIKNNNNNNYLQNAINIDDTNKIINTEFSNCNQIININNNEKNNFDNKIKQNQFSQIKIDTNYKNNNYLSVKTDISPNYCSKENLFLKNNRLNKNKNNANNESVKKIYQNYHNLFSEVNNYQSNYEKMKREKRHLDNKINNLLKTKSHSNLSYLRQKVINNEIFNEEDLQNESVRDLNYELQKMNCIAGNNNMKYNKVMKQYQKNSKNPLIEQFNCQK